MAASKLMNWRKIRTVNIFLFHFEPFNPSLDFFLLINRKLAICQQVLVFIKIGFYLLKKKKFNLISNLIGLFNLLSLAF